VSSAIIRRLLCSWLGDLANHVADKIYKYKNKRKIKEITKYRNYKIIMCRIFRIQTTKRLSMMPKCLLGLHTIIFKRITRINLHDKQSSTASKYDCTYEYESHSEFGPCGPEMDHGSPCLRVNNLVESGLVTNQCIVWNPCCRNLGTCSLERLAETLIPIKPTRYPRLRILATGSGRVGSWWVNA